MRAPALSSTTEGTSPSLTRRALLAVAFLVGFYALALLAVVGLVAVNVVIIATGTIIPKLIIVSAIGVLAVLQGVFFIERKPAADAEGVLLDGVREPALAKAAADAAAILHTSAPDEIRLIPDVNAYVRQESRFLGLRPGRRVLAVGVGLLSTVTVDELRAILAHEMGHYAGGDTRLGPLTYRAEASIRRTVSSTGGPLGGFFAWYGNMFLRMTQGVRRAQELAADRAAAQLAGKEAAASALGRLAPADAAFNHLIGNYVVPIWERDAAPENIYEGLRAVLADAGNEEELATAARQAMRRSTGQYDSHPALAERLAQLAALPDDWAAPGSDAGHPAPDGRLARELLSDPDGAERAVTAFITGRAVRRKVTTVVGWAQVAPDIFAPAMQERAQNLFHAAGRIMGTAPGFGAVLDLMAAGKSYHLAYELAGPSLVGLPQGGRGTASDKVISSHMECALGEHLVGTGGYQWAISWSGPLQLIGPEGATFDLKAQAIAILRAPTGPEAEALRAAAPS